MLTPFTEPWPGYEDEVQPELLPVEHDEEGQRLQRCYGPQHTSP